MRNKISTYVHLLLALAEGSSEKEFELRAAEFTNLLRKRGDARLRGLILREFARRWKTLRAKEALLLTGNDAAEQLVDSLRREMKGYEFSHQRIPELSGGAALFIGSSLMIDGTVRGRLRLLWNQVHNA